MLESSSREAVMTLAYRIMYRAGFMPWEQEEPIADLVDLVDGPDALHPVGPSTSAAAPAATPPSVPGAAGRSPASTTYRSRSSGPASTLDAAGVPPCGSCEADIAGDADLGERILAAARHRMPARPHRPPAGRGRRPTLDRVAAPGATLLDVRHRRAAAPSRDPSGLDPYGTPGRPPRLDGRDQPPGRGDRDARPDGGGPPVRAPPGPA